MKFCYLFFLSSLNVSKALCKVCFNFIEKKKQKYFNDVEESKSAIFFYNLYIYILIWTKLSSINYETTPTFSFIFVAYVNKTKKDVEL